MENRLVSLSVVLFILVLAQTVFAAPAAPRKNPKANPPKVTVNPRETAASQAQRRAEYAADWARRKHLQESGKEWFGQHVMDQADSAYGPIEDLSINVTEPTTILPVDLGGPVYAVNVTLEAAFGGYVTASDHHGYDGFDGGRFMQCRYKQTLRAKMDGQRRPVEIIQEQNVAAAITCGTNYTPSSPRWW